MFPIIPVLALVARTATRPVPVFAEGSLMNTKVFHRLRLPLLAAALTVLLAAGTSAAADPSPDGREYWGGRSAAGTLYCYIHRDGRHWAMTMSSPDKTISIDGVEVARCGAFIELDFHGFHDRVY